MGVAQYSYHETTNWQPFCRAKENEINHVLLISQLSNEVFEFIVLVVFNISVACHNFKTKARNYSIIRRMLSISIFVSFDIVSFVEDACKDAC